MSASTKAKSHKGAGRGRQFDNWQGIDRCGEPSGRQIDAVTLRLIQERPDWRLARCAQRARVEVYLRGAS